MNEVLDPIAVEIIIALGELKVGDEIRFKKSPSYRNDQGHEEFVDDEWGEVLEVGCPSWAAHKTSQQWSDFKPYSPIVCTVRGHVVAVHNIAGWRRKT